MTGTDFLLYRIMKGHLSFRRDGLSLYILEPDQDLMYQSSEVYQEIYDKAYISGVMIKEEAYELMMEKFFYSPFDDMELEKLKADQENLKVECFKNFMKPKNLTGLKYALFQNQNAISKIYKKKSQFDHLTCEGVATLAQWNWIIENSTYYKDSNKLYDWKRFSVNTIMSHYESSVIPSEDFRKIARCDSWRPMWNLGKKTGNLFSRPVSMMTRDQIALCSFSTMYDNVYESTESPPEKVIEDDDCLDGWFIDQKRKYERMKKDQEADAFTNNKKIANAGEIFIMAGSDEEAQYVDGFNNQHSRNIKNERMEMIKGKTNVQDIQFADVAMDIGIQQNNLFANKLRGN
jgi:hypothetical protein